ncbi:hypothetical protein WA577_001150, partial [Blastocystis sp. JDR]
LPSARILLHRVLLQAKTRTACPIPVITPFARLDSTVSAASKGMQFEEQVLQTLLPLGMTLHRCGGPNDRGIDIRGTWHVNSTDIPLIVQCKNTKQSKPQFVREFVGVMNRESTAECNEKPVGLLCLSSSITNSLLRESALSNYPFALVRVVDSHIQSFQPNYALLRCYPDLHFVFDVNATNVPTILYKDTVLFHP